MKILINTTVLSFALLLCACVGSDTLSGQIAEGAMNEHKSYELAKAEVAARISQAEANEGRLRYYEKLERDQSYLANVMLDYFGRLINQRDLTEQEYFILKEIDDILNPRETYYDANGYYHLPSTHSSIRFLKERKPKYLVK